MMMTLRALGFSACLVALGAASVALEQDAPKPPAEKPTQSAPATPNAADSGSDTKPDAPAKAIPNPKKDPYSAENYVRPHDPGLAVGDKAPDVSFIDYDGTEIPLSTVYAERPLILVFVKGAWCSVCSRTMRGWESRLTELDKLGATLIMVCPQKQEPINDTIDSFKLEFPIFSDKGRIARAFKVQNVIDQPTATKFLNHYKLDLSTLHADGTWNVPAHASFIIDTDGTIRYAKAYWPAAVGATPEDVLEALRKLEREGAIKEPGRAEPPKSGTPDTRREEKPKAPPDPDHG